MKRERRHGGWKREARVGTGEGATPMFEFRLGCRFAWLLCRSVFQSFPLTLPPSLSLTPAKENLTFDLARESLVRHTILSPYKSSAAERRSDATRCPGPFHVFTYILCYRLASFFRSETLRCFWCVWQRRKRFHLIFDIRDKI